MIKNKFPIFCLLCIIVLLILFVSLKTYTKNNGDKTIINPSQTLVAKDDLSLEIKDLISKFLLNKELYKSAVYGGKRIFFLPYDLHHFRDYQFIAVNENGNILWKTEVGGFENFDFVDIDKDGVQELLISSDGGGNHSTCIYEFYRYEGNGLFKSIDFKSQDYDGSKINCGNISNVNEFTEFVWNHMYPELYQKYFLGQIVLSDYPDNSPVLCQKEEVVYKYNGSMFTEKSRKTVEKNVNGLDNLRTCIN